MSTASTTPTMYQPTPTPSERALRRATPRGWLSGIFSRTARRWGARLGLAWLGVIAFCAVFAPLLANSHPLLLKMNGQWSSPMLQHLTHADWFLFALTALIGVSLLLRRLAAADRFTLVACWLLVVFPYIAFRELSDFLAKITSGHGGWALGVVYAMLAVLLWKLRGAAALVGAALGAVTTVLLWQLVNPPALPQYTQWREAQAAGQIQWALRAPVPFSPQDRLSDLFDPQRPRPWAPAPGNPLGTDRNGADVLSRLIHACRIALAVGFIAEGVAVVIGVTLGGLMGYRGGLIDLLGMRLVEIFSAIPSLYLLLTFVAFFGRNLYLIMLIIGLTSWTGYALFTRAEFLRLRRQDFVAAAQAAGIGQATIIFRHILPNGLAPVLVGLSFGVAGAIMAEAGLSFLGLGLVEEPSWGAMLNQAVSSGGSFYWWLATFPGLIIFLTVFAYNMIGEALRDAVDPRLAGGQSGGTVE